MKIFVMFGTRPEAIKLAPVIEALKKEPNFFSVKICSTGQHRSMLDQALSVFDIQADVELGIMKKKQTLSEMTAVILSKLEILFKDYQPDRVLVQGDTTTTMAAALSAFYHKIPVDHLEAGLRSHQIYSPFPEEMNRKLTSCLASLHFTSTETAKKNLLNEGVSEHKIFVTGNTVIDALMKTLTFIHHHKAVHIQLQHKFSFLNTDKKIILVTGHRRESFGITLEEIFKAIAIIATREEVQIIYPLHLNPNVQNPAKRILGHLDNVFLIAPQDYISMVYLMDICYLILTDSGGIQEEAPSIGKPILVIREVTERVEGIEAGISILVGTHPENIIKKTFRFLDDPEYYRETALKKNPYGEGHAAENVVNVYRQLMLENKI